MPSDPSPDLPTLGPIAGKYELVRLIGRGGMGTVWEGRHATLGNRVAIKFIDAEYADSPEARTRFDNEARAAAQIQSKHAIQIYDHGITDDGKPYIVMELLVGEPLDQRLDRFKRLPLPETARILRQVARALARAHERGIVHRDLKPENIFLVRTPDDDDEIAKVLDFGIAKFKKVDGQTSGGISSSTKTGAVIGTPFYMSPEQARGLREIDHRSDLWSLGVIAFKCVCGVLPFEGVSIGDLLVKICTSPAPVPSSVVPSLSPSFDAWFARALEKEPPRRFQSALELADALAYAAGLSVKRPMGSLPPSSDMGHAPTIPSTRVGSHPSQAGSASATSAPFTASNPRASASSKSVWVVGGAALVLGVAAAIGGFAVLRAPGNERPRVNVVTTPAAAHATSAASGASTASTLAPDPSGATAKADAGEIDVTGLPRNAPATAPKRHHGPSPKPEPAAAPSASAAAPASAAASAAATATASATPAPAPAPAPTPKPAPAPKPGPAPAPSATSDIDPGY